MAATGHVPPTTSGPRSRSRSLLTPAGRRRTAISAPAGGSCQEMGPPSTLRSTPRQRACRAGSPQSSPARSALSCHPPEERLRLRFGTPALEDAAHVRGVARRRVYPDAVLARLTKAVGERSAGITRKGHSARRDWRTSDGSSAVHAKGHSGRDHAAPLLQAEAIVAQRVRWRGGAGSWHRPRRFHLCDRAPKVRRTCSSVEASSSCVASRVASPCSQRRVAARLRAVQHSSA